MAHFFDDLGQVESEELDEAVQVQPILRIAFLGM